MVGFGRIVLEGLLGVGGSCLFAAEVCWELVGRMACFRRCAHIFIVLPRSLFLNGRDSFQSPATLSSRLWRV